VFITFKLAFGKIVAFIGLGLYVFSGVFVLLGINIINYIVTFLDFIAFIVVLIKLITKKYDLFYLEPEIKVNTLEEGLFYNANVLTTIYSTKDWNLSSDALKSGTFSYCQSLKNQNTGFTYSSSKAGGDYAKVNGGYFTLKG
jgi:hypothetical protein